MKNLFTLALIFTLAFFTNLLNAQNFLVQEWMHTTGIPDTIDWSAATTDGSGNIYVTTNTLVDGEKANILTTKYNSGGVVQWEVTYNSAGNDNDYGTAICVDGSGNVYVAASSYISGNNYDYRTIKYNSSGTLQWNVTYNGPGNFYDVPTDIIVDGSGNVFVTGGSYGSSTLSDFCTIKYNSSGTSQWTSRYNYASDQDIAAIIKFSPSGRVIVAGGSANAPASWDFASIKYNQNTGAQLAANRNSASGAGFDEVYAAETDASGNIYLVGRASVVDEGYNMRTLKIDTSISIVWARNYDHAELNDEAHGIVVDLSNNVYVTGWVTNTDGTKSFETLKYNSSGTLQWSNEENAANSGLDAYALKISNTVDPYLMVAGNVDNGSSLDFMSVIYNTDGDRLWIEQFDDPDKSDDKVNFVKADINGNFFVGGKSSAISTATNRLIKYNWNSYIIPPDDDMAHPTSFTFFENKGQIIDTDNEIREDIKYYTHQHNPSLYFTDDVLSYVWSSIDTTSTNDTLSRIDLSFPGSNGSKVVNRAVSQVGEYLNYYLAHCSDGITNVRSSDRLIVANLYDNVDLEYYFDGAGLKYYLIIKPGYSEQNDPISLFYDGAEEVNILGGGELEILGILGSLKQEIADPYQIDVLGDLVPLGWDAEYIVIDDYEIGFDLGVYDDELPLVIEMKIDRIISGSEDCIDNVIWGTWYGGNKSDIPTDVEIYNEDADGILALYVGGITNSIIFPVELTDFSFDYSGLFFDAFIQKFYGEPVDYLYGDQFEPIWATVIGGSANEKSPYTQEGIKITPILGDKMVFVGTTESSDLPCKEYDLSEESEDFIDVDKNAEEYDGFAGIVSNEGILNWLTYIGGLNGNTILFGVDSYTPSPYDGFIIVGSSYGGTGFPEPIYEPMGEDDPYYGSSLNHFEAGNHHYGCIIEFNYELEVYHSTSFGSYDGVDDIIYDIEIKNRNIPGADDYYYITGQTFGTGLQVYNAYQDSYAEGAGDGFLSKIVFNENKRDLAWSTYFGGLGKEGAVAVTIDNNANVYITGKSENYGIDPSSDMPTYSAGQYCEEEYNGISGSFKGFIAKFDEYGDELLWSTYFGSERTTFCYDITSDGSNIIIIGHSANDESTFPFPDPFEGAYLDEESEESNQRTSFLALFNKNTELLWATYLGDDAFNRASAATTYYSYGGRNELYIVGDISYDDEEHEFHPICDYGEEAYFQPDGYSLLLNQDGYLTAFDLSIFTYLPTNTDEFIKPETSLLIYPNPTLESITIETFFEDPYHIEIFDLSLNLIYFNTNTNISSSNFNLNFLPAGAYLINIISATQFISSKLIKL